MINFKNKYQTHILIFFFSVISSYSAHSAITVNQYTNINGLSNNSVNCIFQDSDNKLWIGTWDGLSFFNGRNFTTYRYNSDKHSLSNNIIRHIEESADGNIWVATDFGINRWDKYSNQFEQYFVDDSNISSKKENAFWIGSLSGKELIAFVDNAGLFYFDNRVNKFTPISEFIYKTNVKKIIINQDNQLYVLFNDGKLKKYKATSNDGKIQIQSLSVDNLNTTPIRDIFLSKNFLVTYTGDYISINDDKNLYPSTINIDKNKTISQVIFYDNHFLIGYYEGGLDVYNSQTKYLVPFSDFSQSTSIFDMYVGSQDILWIGTDGQGLFQLYDYKTAFNNIKTNFPVRSFCEYSADDILVGTKGEGVLLYNKKNHKIEEFASLKNGLLSNSVYAIAKNTDGTIFIGTEGEGLNVVHEGRIKTIEIPKGAPLFKSVYSIAFSNDAKSIWLGTSGFGLIKLDVKKENGTYVVLNVKQYSTSNNTLSFKSNIIYSVVQGADDNQLWVSTRRDGLFLFDIQTETFTNFRQVNTQSNISDNDILTLLKSNETLWVGTSYGLNEINLQHISSSHVKIYTEKQNLANNTIHGILKNNNTVWISTNMGLSEINLGNRNVTSYTIKDGLQNDEFSDGASYCDSDSIFYFGGVAGFNHFNPNDIKLRSFVPKITISNLKIFNTPININERIKNNTLNLNYDEAYITLTFLAEDYINNKNCEYRYRLVNFSDEWINNGQNPNIVLTNLLPGKYNLEVEVTNGDRVWSNSIYTLDIDVAYPWWLSIPAIIVYFILFLLILYLVYLFARNKVRRNRKQLLDNLERENQKKMHESKLDFFTNVAHEFFTPLTLIYGPAQHLLERTNLDNYTKRNIQVIKNNADRMQKLINELMDFRKVESGHTPLFPEKIDLSLLIKYVCDNYTDISEETKITFNIETHNLSLFTTDRNSIEKILFNLISNAFKYTPSKGYINVDLMQTDAELVFTIKNSGNGLTAKQMSEIFNKFKIFEDSHLANAKSTGIGLSLVKGIVELLDGTITVNSLLHEYVEFVVRIPSIQTSVAEPALNENTDTSNYSSQIIERKDVTILIVEDEVEIRELLVNILSPYYNVKEVGDGLEALDTVAKNTPDIIISDILMPNLDGMQLIKQLKSSKTTSHIPIINISAKNSLDDKLNAYEYGADLYITKPFHPRHILVTIQNLIRKQSQLKEYYRSGLSMMTVKDGIPLHQEDENVLNDIISYVEKHLEDESLNPNSIADALGISKASLYRKMEELTQKTPSEFVRNIRLNHAGFLLKSTKMTVQEIMFRSGFSNKSYFYREFAKQFNSSPNEYRQS